MSGQPYVVGNVVEAVEEFDEYASPIVGMILIRSDGERRTWVHGKLQTQEHIQWLERQVGAGASELMACATKDVG